MKPSPKFLQRIGNIVLIALTLSNIFFAIWPQKEKFIVRNYWENFPALESAYKSSQYVSKTPKGWLPDEVVFSYAGGALIKGENPVLVIPDAPPLGKYLIGLSALIFDNTNTISVIFGIISIGILFILSKQVLKSTTAALFTITLFSSEQMLKNQFFFTPLLDIFQLVYLLTYFICINLAFFSQKKTFFFFILASILLGCFISTKFFISGITIVVATLAWTFLNHKKEKNIKFLITLPLSILILLASYARVFAYGYSIRSFLGIQKWVFLYHKSQIILPFSVWPLLLFNRWYVWFGDKPIISDKQWAISWPIITVLSFVTMAAYLFKKINKNPHLEVLMLWTICYLAFLSTGQIFSRYLLILLPILYIISIYGLLSFTQKIIKRTNQNKNLKERVSARNLTAKKRNTKKK